MRLRFLRPLVALVLLCTLIPAHAAPPDDKTLTGFDRESTERERALEARFDSLLKKEELREWMKRLSARPHHVGSAYDRDNAEFLLGLFRSWGYDAQIESFDVLFPTPKTRLLELTAPEHYTARLAEPPLKEDSTSAQTSEQLPTYNAYSVDGDVTAQLVYVNYGVPRDYEELERRGIDVKGRIVIARYGGSWRGALPVTYHIGPGPATVHLKLEFNWNIEPVNDVIARLKGGERPDEWVIRGNHHDAWVNGAADPISGQVAMLEEARAIGELARTGWKPKRTIIYCAWDGEEPGLLGSTEAVETHMDELRRHAVLYAKSGTNGRGFLDAGGSHTLEKFMNEAARDVVDPQKKVSVAARLRARRIMNGDEDARREARERADLRIEALGSGSDFTPFLQHLGVASLNLGFGGEDGGGSYHSIYDSFDHYVRFGDPTFDYGVALAETAGRVVLRFADADTLPLSFDDFTETIAQYVKEVTKLADDTRDEIAEKNRRIADGTFRAAFDPTETYVEPKAEAPAPYLNFAPLQNALARLQESTKNYQTAFSGPAAQERLRSRETQGALDQVLMGVEHSMTRDAGLPRRPWFKHQIYAPGFYTGYGVKTLPGAREAIEQHNWKEAGEQVVVVAGTIENVAAEIDRATALLQGK